MNNRMLVLAAAALMSGLISAASIAALAAPPQGRVVIVNTGTRTVPGYEITVEPDGRLSGTMRLVRGQAVIRRTDKMILPVQQRFFADLAKAEPLNALPIGQNPQVTAGGRRQSTANNRATLQGHVTGAQLLIRYGGRQSPNLREASSTPGRILLQDVKQIIQILRFPVPERT